MYKTLLTLSALGLFFVLSRQSVLAVTKQAYYIPQFNRPTLSTPNNKPKPINCPVKVYATSVDRNCGGGNYKYVNFSCSDGYNGRLGNGFRCVSSQIWFAEVTKACALRACSQ